MNPPSLHTDERGFVLVMVLVTVMLLVVLGVSSTTVTNIELQIAGNDKVAKQSFYQAESATQQAAQDIENASSSILEARNDLEASTTYAPSNLNPRPYRESDLLALLDTDNNGSLSEDEIAAGLVERASSPYSFIVLDKGIASGASQRMEGSSGSRVHEYEIYGHAAVSGGESVIKIGYKRRF